MNLTIHAFGTRLSTSTTVPVSLVLRPACGVPGEYEYPTDSTTLMRLLQQKTDLPSTVLRRFEGDLFHKLKARLLGVELSERVLTDIGYFID